MRQPRRVSSWEELTQLGFCRRAGALSGTNPARCKIIIASCNTLEIYANEVN